MPTTTTTDLRALLRDFRLNDRPPYAWDDEDAVLIRSIVAGLQAQAAGLEPDVSLRDTRPGA